MLYGVAVNNFCLDTVEPARTLFKLFILFNCLVSSYAIPFISKDIRGNLIATTLSFCSPFVIASILAIKFLFGAYDSGTLTCEIVSPAEFCLST